MAGYYSLFANSARTIFGLAAKRQGFGYRESGFGIKSFVSSNPPLSPFTKGGRGKSEIAAHPAGARNDTPRRGWAAGNGETGSFTGC